MAFNVQNAMRFNAVETVDAEFASILAEINYTGDVFEAGITYSDEITNRAGQVFVRRLGKGGVYGSDATVQNGLKFNTDETADALLPLLNIYTLSKSELCPRAIFSNRSTGQMADKKLVVVKAHGEAWQAQAIALLLGGKNGEQSPTNFTAHSDTDALTADNVIKSILDAQTQILEGDGTADICIVSPATRALLLSQRAKGAGFIPETNEDALRKGLIGDILGLKVKVSNHIGKGGNITGKIKSGVTNVHADVLEGATLAKTVDFIVYDHNTLYIDTTFQGLEENPYAPNYIGGIVSIQSVTGLLNTNPERCIVKSTVVQP